VWFANGVRTCYDYDGEGLRFALIENGRRTEFITNGWENLAELDEDGKVVKRVIRGMGIAASEDFDGQSGEGGAYHYYHGNERSDVELITDGNGSVANRYSYDAFGTIINSEETIQNRYAYNGEAYDQITGQYYLRKRFYNPAVCRFTQEDEYRGDGLNLYAFCANNPVKYVDPSGYTKKCDTGRNSSSENESTENHQKMTGSKETDGTTVYYGEFEGGSNTYSRKGAFKKAKRDAGISVSQQPYAVKYEPMRSAEYEGGHIIKDDSGNIIMTREYYFKNNSGETIVIQDHGAGHEKGGQGSHFNVRHEYNTRTGHVPGTQDHYPFKN
jgi:RHS repeat-associated protein